MNLQKIPLSNLVASSQPRPLVTSEVDKLASSIREVGLIQPINVTKTTVVHGIAEAGFKIVAGHHRVAACRALGWIEIDAIVIDDTGHLQCELMEIDENLCRADLTAAQRTAFSKRRKQIWEALHPVAQDAPPARKPDGTFGDGQQGFAASTAVATGQSKATTNRALDRAEALGDEALAKVVNTSLDSGVELDALAKLPEPERTALVERAASGEQVSARHAPTFTPESMIKELAGNLRSRLRSVLDYAGCTSVAELANMVGKEQASASEDDIELLSEAVDLLQSWVDALCFVNVVSLAKRTRT